jgi:phage-related baseplate assembly protein
MPTTPPIIIERTPQEIIDSLIARYEGYTGNTLQPFQVERLMIQTVAYELSLKLEQVQAAGINNLLSFSTAPVLDYLAELLGVTRLASSSAIVTVNFVATLGHPGTTIPSGTRVSSVDGMAVFQTLGDVIISAGIINTPIVCESVTAGSNFNNYQTGTITNILDPVPYISSASNTDVSAGGASQETDDALRERARLAPAAFGTAGANDAYVFWALSANPAIIDVHVPIIPAQPGTVVVYPLLEDGSVTPQVILDQVEEVLTARYVRPMCDTVNVVAPTQITYSLIVNLVIYEDADPQTVQQTVQDNLTAFVLSLRQELGRDVMSDHIIAICAPIGSGVYDVDLGAFTDIVIAENEYAFCTSVGAIVTGTNAG